MFTGAVLEMRHGVPSGREFVSTNALFGIAV